MEKNRYLILGASSDIGIAYIKDLDERLSAKGENAAVVAHFGFKGDRLQELKNDLRAVEVLPVQADLSQPDGVVPVLKYAEEHLDCPDCILHLPASRLMYQKLKQFDWENVLRDMSVQVGSFAETCRVFLPRMAKRRSGRVAVMLSSCTIGMPPKFLSQYVTVKYALLGMMKAMAAEYGDKGIGINGISPNMIETQFLQNVDERIVELNRENCLQKRNVRVEEVVAAIRYLLSEDAAYVNGVNLNLTGGDR